MCIYIYIYIYVQHLNQFTSPSPRRAAMHGKDDNDDNDDIENHDKDDNMILMRKII